MKNRIITTVMLGAFLFTTSHLSASNKDESKALTIESHQTKKNHVSETEKESNTGHAMLGVQGKCEMCKKRIETAAKSVDGVSSAQWNAKKKELHVSFNSKQTSLDAISKAIAKIGYDTEKDKADDETYANLPACCKYRK